MFVLSLSVRGLKWLDIHTHHGETVAVPDVKGMTVDEAAKMFTQKNLFVLKEKNSLIVIRIAVNMRQRYDKIVELLKSRR